MAFTFEIFSVFDPNLGSNRLIRISPKSLSCSKFNMHIFCYIFIPKLISRAYLTNLTVLSFWPYLSISFGFEVIFLVWFSLPSRSERGECIFPLYSNRTIVRHRRDPTQLKIHLISAQATLRWAPKSPTLKSNLEPQVVSIRASILYSFILDTHCVKSLTHWPDHPRLDLRRLFFFILSALPLYYILYIDYTVHQQWSSPYEFSNRTIPDNICKVHYLIRHLRKGISC